MTGFCLSVITGGGTVIKIIIKRPDDMRPQVQQAMRSGIGAMTSKAVDIQKDNVPVKIGTLRRSIYGDFTQLDNFKGIVIQDPKVAPYGPITNDGYDGIIMPKHAKALKLHTKGGIIYRKSVHGQAGTHWWEKIKEHAEDLNNAFTEAFNKVIGRGG
jgi:hypothetical protein